MNTLFFWKNLFYKNVEAEIYQNFKKVLRTYPGLRVGEHNYLFCQFVFINFFVK